MTVLVFGSANADLVFAVPQLPAPGETVLGQGVRSFPGGKGANQAVAAALDGAAVAFAGCIGRDGFAEVATSALRGAGVDLSRLVVTAEPTGCASNLRRPGGRNQIAVAPGANALRAPRRSRIRPCIRRRGPAADGGPAGRGRGADGPRPVARRARGAEPGAARRAAARHFARARPAGGERA
jgi:sugar/nucleoside kinase (ribokinase family)